MGLETRIFDGSRTWLGSIEAIDAEGIEDRLEAAGQDFHLDDSIDCGLLGTTVAPADLRATLPAGVRAEVTRMETGGRAVPLGVVFDGWVEGAAIDCALLLDLDGEVVGAGGSGSVEHGYGGPGARDLAGREWFSGVAPRPEGTTTVVVRLQGHDGLYALPSPT